MSPRREPQRPDLANLPVNVWFVGQRNSLAQRRGRYHPSTIHHPGKMLPELARQLIEHYTRPGDWILDPMSGVGTTGVEAVHLGRHYVGVELEPRFVHWQNMNLEVAHSQGATGEFEVIEGDARRLTTPVDPTTRVRRVDAVITSPPYGARLRSVRTPSPVLRSLIRKGAIGRHVIPTTYGQSAGNLGNLSDADYLREMQEVYRGCYDVLRPGGYLVIVIRPGRERYQLRPLHHETARMCVELGFEFVDEIVAVTGRVALPEEAPPAVVARSLFFKRLAIAHLRAAGHPVTLEQLEYVLAFRKPDYPVRMRVIPLAKSGLSAALGDPSRRPGA